MSLQVEKLEKGMAKLTIEVPAEEFTKAIEVAYNKNKKKISVPGFRAGKVPRAMIEKMYGKDVFSEDAANSLIADSKYAKPGESAALSFKYTYKLPEAIEDWNGVRTAGTVEVRGGESGSGNPIAVLEGQTVSQLLESGGGVTIHPHGSTENDPFDAVLQELDPATGEVVKEANILGIGTLVTAIIDFLIVAFICFLIVKVFNKARRAA